MRDRDSDKSPGNIVELINLFLDVSHAICTQNGGVIDKIIGNTLMMFFRGSLSGDNHQLKACNTALQIMAAFADEGSSRKFLFSGGMSSGNLVSGKIGSRTGKLDYTVIGDAANMAARLKSHAEHLEIPAVICSDSLTSLRSDLMIIKPEAEIRIKGKIDRCRIYRLVPV
ncbi:MAG: adenylate/guanylate cyclase domain-containing protein [Candidatus Riflebacteria bacterium]|nr:adenylate/guanylate cyclase domain-containing protein [Candidatus Riflebacteria bacterium]